MVLDQRQNRPVADDALLDATGRRLLAELQADARLSLAELGRRVGLSSPAVAERLRRLQDAGVIRGFHADVDPRALGYGLTSTSACAPARACSPTPRAWPERPPR